MGRRLTPFAAIKTRPLDLYMYYPQTSLLECRHVGLKYSAGNLLHICLGQTGRTCFHRWTGPTPIILSLSCNLQPCPLDSYAPDWVVSDFLRALKPLILNCRHLRARLLSWQQLCTSRTTHAGAQAMSAWHACTTSSNYDSGTTNLFASFWLLSLPSSRGLIGYSPAEQ